MSRSDKLSLSPVCLESLETRTLLDADLIQFDAANPAMYTAANGDSVIVRASRNVTGTVHRDSAGNADASRIEIVGGTTRDTVRVIVRGRGGDGRTSVGDIDIDGSLRALHAPALDLTGDVEATGVLGSLWLGDIVGDTTHNIEIHTDAGIPIHPRQTLTMRLGSASDVNIDTNFVPIATLRAVNWLDVNATEEAITAPWIKRVIVTGSRTENGDFQSDIQTGSIGLARVRGDLSNSDWQLTDDLGRLIVGRWVDSSRIDVGGSIGAVVAGGVDSSDFLAGVDTDGRHATGKADFDSTSSIRRFVVRGWRVPRGDTTRFFVDSNVSAASIGRAVVKNIEFDAGADNYGFYARSAQDGREIGVIRHIDTQDRSASFVYSPRRQSLSNPPAFVIQPIDNNSPTANAGSDVTIEENQPVILTGSGNDLDGDPMTYSWKQVAGPAVAMNNSNQAAMDFVAPLVDADTQLTFQLTVRDNVGGVATDTVVVTVLNGNTMPVIGQMSAEVLAGPGTPFAAANRDGANGDGVISGPCNAYEGRYVLLSGLGSDAEGDVTYSWSQIHGVAATISNAGTSEATIVVPELPAGTTADDARLEFQLTVTDGSGASVTGVVVVRARLAGDVDFDDVVEGGPGGEDWAAIFNAQGDEPQNLERYDLNLDGDITIHDMDTAATNNTRALA
jgi:hypothetical protein